MGMAGAELGGGEGTIINAGRIIFHFQPYQCGVRAIVDMPDITTAAMISPPPPAMVHVHFHGPRILDADIPVVPSASGSL